VNGGILAWPWGDPIVLAAVAVLTFVALARRWSIVLLLALLYALAQGLDYLMHRAAFGPDFIQGVVVGVYGLGGALLVVLVVAHWITRKKKESE
jgi:hypothetical protein